MTETKHKWDAEEGVLKDIPGAPNKLKQLVLSKESLSFWDEFENAKAFVIYGVGEAFYLREQHNPNESDLGDGMYCFEARGRLFDIDADVGIELREEHGGPYTRIVVEGKDYDKMKDELIEFKDVGGE